MLFRIFMELTISELKLISCLRENSREKLTTISKNTHIPISTLFDMLREMQCKLFSKSTILLNYAQLGYHTQAQVFLKVERAKREALQKHLECHGSVNSIYKINNGWDFLIETVHKNIRELNDFLEELEEKYFLEEKEIYYLVEEVKKEGFEVN